MALASTSNEYGSMRMNENSSKKNSDSASSQSHNLDFFQSMHHFKTMFPKFDSEVIETVLRSNDGAVDKTVDQLLTMSMDSEFASVENMIVDLSVADQTVAFIDAKPSSASSTIKAITIQDSNDQPPSYNEFLALKMSETSNQLQSTLINTAIQESNKSKCPAVLINDSDVQSSFSSSVKQIDASINCEKTNENLNESPSFFSQDKPRMDVGREFNLLERKSRVLIGELSNSFLRIKLSSEQVKKFKTNIKKAKRNEITAILNNKTSEIQPVSREIKKKFNMLNEQIEPEETLTFDEDWQSRYNTVTKSYENRRIQIIQDEYIAKLMQNEEFLNEIKTNNDFMQTLNQESNRVQPGFSDPYFHSKSLKSSEKHTELSNAELKSKLLRMGKASKVKLAKLGTAFTTGNKNKYRQAVEESNATCSSIFTEVRPESSLQDEDFYCYNQSKSETNFNGSEFDNSPKPSRYQKAYKSFKSVLRRNSSSSSTPIGLTIKSTNKHRSSAFDDDLFEEPTKLDNNAQELTKFTNDLVVFDNEYSYENNKKKDFFDYDFTTYPFTKTTSPKN